MEPKYRKYVEGYDFLPFPRNVGDKYSKKLIDTATKTGTDSAKAASKRVVQKAGEATENLTWNKIADKTTSAGRTKSKENEKQDKTNKRQEMYITPKKIQQIIDDLRYYIKMEYQRIINLLDAKSDNAPKFTTKK